SGASGPSGPSSPTQHREFAFDGVFDPAASQTAVFGALSADVVDHALLGFNTCLFAYGQTGSGKTHSMTGAKADPGVAPRACALLFRRIAALAPGVAVAVAVSFVEIYNEKVRDLLCANPAKPALRVREHPTLGPYCEDLSKLVVTSFDQIERLMDLGNSARTTAATNMNDVSSRSHVTGISPSSPSIISKIERSSRICLVDLAGSERADSTGASGARLKEGANINKSLTTLGKVISALAEASDSAATASASRRSIHIPYRDSTLTWLLKDCIGGNSKTIMMATISPSEAFIDETLSTLRYAERAKKIVNRAVVNEDETGKTVRLLQEEVDKLKRRLATYEEGGLDETLSRNISPMGSRRASVMEDGGGGGGKGLDALRDQLLASEKLIAEMTESYEARLQKSIQIETQRSQVLQELGISIETRSSSSVGVHAPKTVPHLLNLSEDPMVSECLLYRLPIGIHGVGSTPKASIFLASPSILPEHAFLECTISSDPSIAVSTASSKTSTTLIVILRPNPDGITFVNSFQMKHPVKLNPGDRILFGETALFKFANPTELSIHVPPPPSSPHPSLSTHSSSNGYFVHHSDESRYSMECSPRSSSPSRSGSSLVRSTTTLSGTSPSSESLNDFRGVGGGGGGGGGGPGYAKSPDSSSSSSVGMRFAVGPSGQRQKQMQHLGLETGGYLQQSMKSRSGSAVSSSRGVGGSGGKHSRSVSFQAARGSKQAFSEADAVLARRVLDKWRSRNYVALAQEILKSAVFLKEANIIAKELSKNVFYEFRIVSSQSVNSFTSLSSRGGGGAGGAGGAGAHKSKPFLVVQVFDGHHNSAYKWLLPDFKTRLESMRTLYDYIDPDNAPSKFYAHQRAITSELSFYNGKTEGHAYYQCIGTVGVDVRCLSMGILKEVRAPVVCGEKGDILGWLLVVIAPISAVAAGGSGGGGERHQQQQQQQHGDLKVGHQLVFEVSILEMTGISESVYTQIHCQFRLSDFTGQGDGFSATGRIGSGGGGGGGDRVFATDPADGFGDSPIRWNFSQTISMQVTEAAKYVLERGIVKFEVFARHIRPISDVIDEKFHKRGSPSSAAVPVITPVISTHPSLSPFNEVKEHVILAQIEIAELSAFSGEFKPVPVQTSFRSPADVFMIRQGIQRRIKLRLSHSSGKYDLPWRRISYVKIGQIRRIDMKSNRPLEDEPDSPEMIGLQVPGLVDQERMSSEDLLATAQNHPFFSNNGQSSLEIEIPWDTSVHNCVYLNRPTKGFKLELTICWGVEVDPLNDGGSTFDLLSSIGLGSGNATTRYAIRSNALFMVETFPVSATLVPKTKPSSRARMAEIDTRNGYVRGEESLADWKPEGQELVIRFWKRREKESRLHQLSSIRSRIEEYEMFSRDLYPVRENISEQESRVLLAKSMELWRNTCYGADPALVSMSVD
ncbi:hypothetical protein BDR26DRAFT_805988, partial [Obelidium mucronatum]